MSVACEAPGDNHSPDRIAVYSGRPDPTILCGFHEMATSPRVDDSWREPRG